MTLVSVLPGLFVYYFLAASLFMMASMWIVFEKAGQPGWAIFIPVYNIYVLLEITGRPIWWILLFILPVTNMFMPIMLSIDLARSFGRGIGFGVGLAFLGYFFLPILAFGDDEYEGGLSSF